MCIEILQQGEFCIVRLKGRLASGANSEFMESKLEEIRSLTAAKVLADFSEVTSMGSMGLGFVVRVFEAVTKRPFGRLVVAELNPRVREVFRVTRLCEIIPIAADFDAGMRMLESDAAELSGAGTNEVGPSSRAAMPPPSIP